MAKFKWENGVLVKNAQVEIEGKVYDVTPAQYEGKTPLSEQNLNIMQDGLIDLIWPIGSYYETSDSTFDPNAKWGGIWNLENDGTILVSKSDVEGSSFNINIGEIIGEEKHKLEVPELPNYSLTYEQGYGIDWVGGHNGDVATANSQNQYAQNPWLKSEIRSKGEDIPHNNIQPSKIVNRWHRTA